MTFLVMPDSFKGTLTSLEVGQIVVSNLRSRGYQADYLPISDGGDGFTDCLAFYQQAITSSIQVKDALGNYQEAHYLVVNDTCYIELAQCVGITKIAKADLNPYNTSTYGLGEAIRTIILKHHPKKMVITLGGSASIDGGSGMLEALGCKFYNQSQQPIVDLCNAKLANIEDIDYTEMDQLLKNIQITGLVDVTNPLLGKQGAVYVFAPQKGASQADLPVLEQNLNHFATIIGRTRKKNLHLLAGSGAAGGCGFGLLSCLKGRLSLGIEYLLDLIDFNHRKKQYDIIITGEGRFDSQSLDGKVISGIRKHWDGRLIVLCGSQDNLSNGDYEVYSINPEIAPLEESLKRPAHYLNELVNKIPLF